MCISFFFFFFPLNGVVCISSDKVDSCLFSKTDDLYANRTTQSLLSATVYVTEKHLRLETLGAVSFFHLNSLTCLMLKFEPVFCLPIFSTVCGLAKSIMQLPFLYLVVPLSLKPILNFQKISSLAENTSSKIVFNEVLATAGRDIVTKDISRLRGGWSMQDAFYVSSISFTVRRLLL